MHLRRLATDRLSPAVLDQLRSLLDLAFDGDFSDDDWGHALGGIHVLAVDDGCLVAHASAVPRLLEVDGRPIRTGYVEAVATRPDRRMRGLGSQVMSEIGEVVRSRYEMGALSTGRRSFYERLGWERWRGPTFVREGDGLRRTSDEDGGLLVLRVGPGVGVDLDAPISCEARAGDDW